MKLQSIEQLEFENKKVFVRIDLDSGSIKNKKVLDSKLEICLPTIKYLLDQDAKVIIGTHIGNSKNDKNSLEEVGLTLSRLLERDIVFLDNILNDAFKKLIVDLHSSSVILLENLIFFENEINNDSVFAEFLSKQVDYYVNESFALSNLNFASLDSVLNIFDSEKIAVGFNFINEYSNLKIIKDSEESPFIIILNGNDVSQKIELATLFIEKVDKIILMGTVANSYSKTLGSDFSGNYDKDSLYLIKQLVSSAKTRNLEIIKIGKINSADKFEIPLNDVEYFTKIISSAKKIVWFGPVEGLGDLEISLKESDAYISSLGDEAYASLKGSENKDLFDYVSTSGNISFEYLKNNSLIVLEKLEEL